VESKHPTAVTFMVRLVRKNTLMLEKKVWRTNNEMRAVVSAAEKQTSQPFHHSMGSHCIPTKTKTMAMVPVCLFGT
jgi:hypothetical protein